MYRKILVPVDLTDRHTKALDSAGHLARQAGGEVTVLHVIEPIHGASRDEEAEFYDRLERTAQAHLERQAEHLAAQQVPAQTAVVYGPRGTGVVRFAHEQQFDLIVLMSHPIDVTQPGQGWGTLSYFIGVAARCPVLLVK
jgi:nucleotide-binding universal stress UspA family protein